MAVLYYSCRTCGGQIGPLVQTGDAVTDVKPASCPTCESRGPFVIDQQTTQYRNYQKITLQVRCAPSLAVHMLSSTHTVVFNMSRSADGHCL